MAKTTITVEVAAENGSPEEAQVERCPFCSDSLLAAGWTCFQWYANHIAPIGPARRLLCRRRECAVGKSQKYKLMFSNQYNFNMYRKDLKRDLARRSGSNPALMMMHNTAIQISNEVISIPRRLLDRPRRFIYPDIDLKGQFRCFELSPGGFTDPICGKLLIASWSDTTPFEAISYRWGNPGRLVPLHCEDGCVFITEQAATALRYLRTPYQARVLWIDAICIDQQNAEEKAALVHRMDDIYSRAWRTIIWLGAPDAHTQDAYDLLAELQPIFDQNLDFSSSPPGPEVLSLPAMPKLDDHRWLALASLLNNSWFSRTWVLQEATLAKNPYVQCGHFKYVWFHLQRIIFGLSLPTVQSILRVSIKPAILVASFESAYRSSERASLLCLLHLTAEHAAGEPKDKVWGILSMAADRDIIKSLIDYNKDSAQTVYYRIARHYVSHGDLKVLNFATDPSLRILNDMPTWVPDWSCMAGGLGIARFLPSNKPLKGDVSFLKPRVEPRFEDKGRTLVLSGRIVDKVKFSGQAVTPMNSAVYAFERLKCQVFFGQWRHVANKLTSYPTGEPVSVAFQRTMSLEADPYNPGEVHQKSLVRGVYEYWNEPSRCRRCWPDEFDHEVSPRLHCLKKRTFFITHGGYMGIGPYFLRPDDLIVLFDSSVTPFVIRETGAGRYKLVGDAFVRGMMNNEFGDVQWDEIRLE